MKRFFLICFVAVSISGYGQLAMVDSLKNDLRLASNDTMRMILAGQVMNIYRELNSDSAYSYSVKTRDLARALELKLDESHAECEIGYSLMNLGNFPRALESFFKAAALGEDPSSERVALTSRYPPFDVYLTRDHSVRAQRLANLARIYQDMAILYLNLNNFAKAKQRCELAIVLGNEANNRKVLSIVYSTLGRTYFLLNKPDSALICHQKSLEYTERDGYTRYTGTILLNLGRAYGKLGDAKNAKKYYKEAMVESQRTEYFRGVVASNLEMAKLYREANLMDSSFYYTTNGLKVAQTISVPEILLRCYKELVNYYTSINKADSSAKYLSKIVEINEKVFSVKLVQEFQNIDFEEQQRKQQLAAAEESYRNKLWNYTMAGGIGIVALIAFILFRSNQRKQRDKSKIESAFQQLKATQSQLIQSEKMASLGELTSGIAHEIQNPLNFVNNFSEVSNELIDEMESELQAGNVTAASEIASNIKQNLEKIAHHGKRADGIVRGMLQHSRSGAGQKEPTDINALCDEYLRLAYHGFRAKDKSFNTIPIDIGTESSFDKSLPKVDVVSRDIGRVILNLISNAFYAVGEKNKAQSNGYEPAVKVSTQVNGDRIQIKVADNGNGIPDSIKEKIFQPFFTTKPTGQGTGLGLSLSYDIIKAHGGTLTMKSKEGEGTEFIVQLPV